MSWPKPERSVLDIVQSVRGIRAWVDDEIRKGRTDDEIIAQAPLAIAFINGDVSISELERRVDEAKIGGRVGSHPAIAPALNATNPPPEVRGS